MTIMKMKSIIPVMLVIAVLVTGNLVSAYNLSGSGKLCLDSKKNFSSSFTESTPVKTRDNQAFKWHKRTTSPGESIGNNSLLHGRDYEPEVGLYYYRNRYYHPQLGRFLQQDPMGYEDSMNLYQAFNQNPVNFTDPMGTVLNLKLKETYGSLENAEFVVKSVYAKFIAAGDTHSAAYSKLIAYKFVIDTGSKNDELYKMGLAALPSLGVFDVTPIQFAKDTGAGTANGIINFFMSLAKGSQLRHRLNTTVIMNESDVLALNSLNKLNEDVTDKVCDITGGRKGSLGHFVGEVYVPAILTGYVGAQVELASQTAQTEVMLPFLGTEPYPLVLDPNRFPETASHVQYAQDAGHPSVQTINRDTAELNRLQSLRGYKKVPGKQLDEYPPAMFKEGGKGASVRPITPKDNMGTGAYIGNKLRKFPNGKKIKIIVKKS